jgi:hypothetical protein
MVTVVIDSFFFLLLDCGHWFSGSPFFFLFFSFFFSAEFFLEEREDSDFNVCYVIIFITSLFMVLALLLFSIVLFTV